LEFTFSREPMRLSFAWRSRQRGDIFKIAVGEGALIVAFGLSVGLAGSVAPTRLLQNHALWCEPCGCDYKCDDFGIVGSRRHGGMFSSSAEAYAG
jgi:hypothetical protein